jgi:hypothetical protein
MGQAFAQHIASIGTLNNPSRFSLESIAHTLHGQKFTPLRVQQPTTSPDTLDGYWDFVDVALDD